jgi:YidC/Oxa1 family membrane protein insertase
MYYNSMIRIFKIIVLIVFINLSVSKVFSTTPESRNFSFPRQELLFSNNADIVKITTYYSQVPVTHKDSFSLAGLGSLLKINITGNNYADSCMQSARLSIVKTENDSVITLQFTSDPFLSGMTYRKTYSVFKDRYSINVNFQVSDDSGSELLNNCKVQLGLGFDSTQLKGLHPVYIGKKAGRLGPIDPVYKENLVMDRWIGVQDKFSVLCIKKTSDSASLEMGNGKILLSEPYKNSKNYVYQIYCGPVVYKELKKTDHNLTRLLYPLWFWIRWLSIGLLLIFDKLLSLSGSVVPAIIFLSVCVKIIIAPLYKIANRWQILVNQQSSLLQPRLSEIKAKYKGEEQNNRILAVYKELGISPLYSLKSLLSTAIQIPVFFAAYHMLSEHIALSNVPFLWITDLSSPDHLMKLPFTIPLLGNYLNVMPFIMTSITIVTSWLHTDTSLSVVLQKKQRNNLYVMSALFFVLLYTSPAGMVLYWTMNNVLAFLSTIGAIQLSKLRSRSST